MMLTMLQRAQKNIAVSAISQQRFFATAVPHSRMPSEKNYYKILGVEKDADENQIKKAYRKAAIIHHPDKNRDDEQAEERFKDIGEAYETLSDPE